MRVVLVIVLVGWLLGGCGSGTSPQFSVPAGEYARAFDATRELLRSYRFSLERVDAAAGVITTAPKSTAGAATPWDGEQSSMADEFEDLLNQQTRRVRVTFRPAVPETGEHAFEQTIDPAASLVGRVEVVIYRTQTPELRSPARAVLLTTVATDPALTAEGVPGQYVVPVRQDSRFAARLATAIQRALGPAPVGEGPGPDQPRRLARP